MELKKKSFLKVLKWILISLFSIVFVLFLFGMWIKGLVPPKNSDLEITQSKDLPYISKNTLLSTRGKILAVVTSTDIMGTSGKSTGFELTELARAYYVFKANGFEVDIASPLGGKPPVVIDDEDMGAYDHAFLNDSIAQFKMSHTIPIDAVEHEAYEAVYFVGGKGAMFDFPDNTAIQHLIRQYYQSNKVIGAVCHGPAALVNVTLDNDRPLLENKNVSGFTNKEELFLIAKAKSIFPFLLQDKLMSQGANFNEGPMYLEKISHHKNLITGQNPWSVWAVAETMVEQMGYVPKHREITDEENAEKVLSYYNAHGKSKTKEMIEELVLKEKKPIKRLLVAKHAIVAAMKGEMGVFFDLLELTSFIKAHSE